MTHSPSRRTGTPFLLGAAIFALPLLIGCQGPKVVAKVNDKNILADDYCDRVEQVRGQSFSQQSPSMDAGALTLAAMIQTDLIDSLAAEQHAVPSDEKVRSYAALVKRIEPDQIANSHITDADLQQQMKLLLEEVAIGTDGASVSDSDIQNMYNELKTANQLDYPALYSVRMLPPLPDLNQARQLLDELKKAGNFKAFGISHGMSPEQASALAPPTVISSRRTKKELTNALDKLAPNAFTPEPIAISSSDPNNPTAPPQTSYIVGQLVSKEPGKTPTIAEIHPFLEVLALQHKFPQWQQHEAKSLADYTLKAKIEIFIPRYQTLVNEMVVGQARAMQAQMSAPPTFSAPPGGPGSSPGAGPGAGPGTSSGPGPGAGSAPKPGGSSGSRSEAGPGAGSGASPGSSSGSGSGR